MVETDSKPSQTDSRPPQTDSQPLQTDSKPRTPEGVLAEWILKGYTECVKQGYPELPPRADDMCPLGKLMWDKMSCANRTRTGGVVV